jgi:hypothetical protein
LRERAASGFVVGQRFLDVEVFRVLHRRDEAARKRALVADDDGGRQMLRVRVNRVAEERKLHDRQADDHAEGDAVAPQLQELLEHDAPPARDGEAREHLERRAQVHCVTLKLSVERLIR